MYSLFVARGYPDEKYKTHGIFEFDQALALKNQGCKLVYAAVDLRSVRRWRKWGIYQEKIAGIDFYSINIPLGRLPSSLLRKVYAWALQILYKRIFKDHGQADLIHSHFPNLSYAALKLKQKTKIPLVVSEHFSQINKDEIEANLFKVAQDIYRQADALIVVSPSLGVRIKDHFNQEFIYIPNIVDLEVFNYQEKKASQGFTFVSVGNLIDTKRMDLTIKAFYKNFKDKPDVTLKIFGGGPNFKALSKLIKDLKLENQVFLKGLSSRTRIAETFKQADCFVLPSQAETFGVAYIEALAMGLVVIATKCGGPEAFIDQSNGLLIDVDNERQLIWAMDYMFKNADTYDHFAIAKKTQEQFSAKAVAKQIMDVYSDVLKA